MKISSIQRVDTSYIINKLNYNLYNNRGYNKVHINHQFLPSIQSMYSSELMSINETVTCPFLTSCNVSLDLERETKNIGARRVGLLYLTSVFSYNLDFTLGPCKILNCISNTEVSI